MLLNKSHVDALCNDESFKTRRAGRVHLYDTHVHTWHCYHAILKANLLYLCRQPTHEQDKYQV